MAIRFGGLRFVQAVFELLDMGPIGGNEANGNFTNEQEENVWELCDKILQNLSNAFEKDELL